MTLQPVIDSYLLVCQIEGLSLFAVKMFREVLEEFSETHRDLHVSDLNPAHVNEYVASLEGRKAQQAKGILRMFCHWLIVQNKMRYVPAQPRCVSDLYPVTSKVKRNWAV
jgi:site-specific recombinase XerC